MAAQYPTAVVTTTQLPTNIVDSTPTNAPDHAAQHVQLNSEVIAIETALGTSPQGSYSTVSAALATHGTLITAAQTTATTGVTLATAAQTTANTAVTAASTAQSTANTALTTATAAQTTANTAATAATAAQTTANARATYPGAGVPLSTGSAWGSSYVVGTATGNLIQVTSTGGPSVYYPYIVIYESQAANTQGATSFLSTAWTTVVINNKTDPNGIATLASNLVTLPTGTYLIQGSVPGIGVDSFQSRVLNTTAGTTLVWGSSEDNAPSSTSSVRSFINGSFSITASSTIGIQIAAQTTSSAFVGRAANRSGATEIYSQATITKIA